MNDLTAAEKAFYKSHDHGLLAIIIVSHENHIPAIHTFSDTTPTIQTYTQDNSLASKSVLGDKLDSLLRRIKSVNVKDYMTQAFNIAGSETDSISKEFDLYRLNGKGAIKL